MYTGLLVVLCAQVTVSAVASMSEIFEEFETTNGLIRQENTISMAAVHVSANAAHTLHRWLKITVSGICFD